MGGYDKLGDDSSLSVLTCSLTALLKSCNSQSLMGRMKALSTGHRPTVWRKVTDVPVYLTTHEPKPFTWQFLSAVMARASVGAPLTTPHPLHRAINVEIFHRVIEMNLLMQARMAPC